MPEDGLPLTTSLSRTQPSKAILEVKLQEDLEQMCNRLTDMVNSKYRAERGFALLVLFLTTHTVRPLTCREMLDILTISSLRADENDGDYPNLHNQSPWRVLVQSKKPFLIDPRYPSSMNTYRLINLSAKDYFTSTDGTANTSTEPSSRSLSAWHIFTSLSSIGVI